jgi:hypothetical protein
MNQTASSSTGKVTILRWVARIVGTLFVTVVLFLFVGECVEKGKIAVDSDRIVMSIFCLLTFVGLIIAWKWEGIGGTLAVCGLVGFNASTPWSVVNPVNLLITGMYGIPAVLFLFCWWQTRKHSQTKTT